LPEPSFSGRKKIKKQQQAFDWLLLIFKKSQVLQNEA